MNVRPVHRLGCDQRGVTAVEFALIAPVLLMSILGLFDLGHTMYTTTVLQGAIQKAARNASIEGADDATIDARVAHAVGIIAPGSSLDFKRTSYTNFSDVGKPEDFTDLNADTVCNDGEPFEDANGNGRWDADRGKAGGGGARDAVLYIVKVTYHHPFPAARFIGGSDQSTIVARTVLRNQPFSLQERSDAVGNCP